MGINVTKLDLEYHNPSVKPGGVYHNPLSDEGFKKLLGSTSSLISFLNATMHLDKFHEIDKLKFRSKRVSYQIADRDSVEKKTWCFDIRAQTRDGRAIDAEVQNLTHDFFKDRVMTYGAALMLKAKAELDKARADEDKKKIESRTPPELTTEERQERRRQIYELPETVCIWVCNFPVPEDSEFVRDEWGIYSANALKKGNLLPISNRIKYIFIQLPNFNKSADELETIEDQWIFVLKNAFASGSEISIENDAVTEALDRIRADGYKEDKDMMTREERDCIVASLEHQAELRGFERGEQSGFERGEQSGFERGEQSGFERGFERARKEYEAEIAALKEALAAAKG